MEQLNEIVSLSHGWNKIGHDEYNFCDYPCPPFDTTLIDFGRQIVQKFPDKFEISLMGDNEIGFSCGPHFLAIICYEIDEAADNKYELWAYDKSDDFKANMYNLEHMDEIEQVLKKAIS